MKENREHISKNTMWTGRVVSGFAVLFMLFDSITKILKVDAVMKATAQLGYPTELISVIGVILLVCVVIYVVPRTSILGAILLTGYLGGAVATNLRMGTPIFSNALFPVYFGFAVWAGLYLRDVRLRSMLASKKS